MYISATGAQVKNQFLSSLNRFWARPAFAGWNWRDPEGRTPEEGFVIGRATDTAGHIERIHDHPESPAGLLVEKCKSIADDVLDALERCHARFRLFVTSTGPAFGGC